MSTCLSVTATAAWLHAPTTRPLWLWSTSTTHTTTRASHRSSWASHRASHITASWAFPSWTSNISAGSSTWQLPAATSSITGHDGASRGASRGTHWAPVWPHWAPLRPLRPAPCRIPAGPRLPPACRGPQRCQQHGWRLQQDGSRCEFCKDAPLFMCQGRQ